MFEAMPTPTPVPVDPIRGFGWTFTDVPSWLTFVAAAVTQLGDPWFLFVALAGLYWVDPDGIAGAARRTGGVLVALGIAAVAVTTLLKTVFALPRPPGAASATLPTWFPAMLAPVYHNIATGTGFGFPSGHAIGSTVAYGGMAMLLDVWTRRRRALVATGLVVLICLSRLVLGVHFFVDVLAGVGVGLAVLLLGLTRPDRAFGVAALLSVGAFALALYMGYGEPLRAAVATLGAGVGGFLAWRAVGPTTARVSLPTAVVGFVGTGGVWVAASILHPPLPILAVVDGLAVATVVALPTLAERF